MRKNPEKTSPRKPVPTGDRTRARCVTSAHATTCSTAVDIIIIIIIIMGIIMVIIMVIIIVIIIIVIVIIIIIIIIKLIRQTKRKYEKDQLLEIEKDFQTNNTRNFYKTFKTKLIGYQPQSLCFKREDGQQALNNQENCRELAKYFEKPLNCPIPISRFTPQEP